MKILVVSLLRLGDIILTAPVIEGLRQKYPEAQIDILINAQFRRLTPLLPQIKNVYLFERDAIQRGLGEANVPLFEPFDRVDALIDQLTANNYDQVLNLTHTRLSGWIVSLIPAQTKIGLTMDASGKGSFGNNWFRYLNQQTDDEGSETFHFTDFFRFGLSLDAAPFGLQETSAGRAEAESFVALAGGRPIVAIQALTSDKKKDWSPAKWTAALNLFAQSYPEAVLILVGAPNEREALEALAVKTTASVAILSLEGAYSFLKRARMLITGDTSIKHLACAAGTPVVEICLGSSDAHRTGAYQSASVIVQSREACAPCVHSRACHRDSHACGDRIPPEAVALIAGEVYSGRSFQLRTIADEYRSEIEVLQVQASEQAGYWAAPSTREVFSEKAIARWIDLSSKKLWLSGSADRGAELEWLAAFLKDLHSQRSEIEWRFLFEDFEAQVQFAMSRMNGFKVGLDHLKGDFESAVRRKDLVRAFVQFREQIRTAPLLRSFVSLLDPLIEIDDASAAKAAFPILRRMSEVVSEMDRRTLIIQNLLRGLRDELQVERSGAPRTGAKL